MNIKLVLFELPSKLSNGTGKQSQQPQSAQFGKTPQLPLAVPEAVLLLVHLLHLNISADYIFSLLLCQNKIIPIITPQN